METEVNIEEVYRWASQLTAEARGTSRDCEYLWPKAGKRLLLKLNLSKGGLIGLLGLQGTGKSTCLEKVRWSLGEAGKKVVSFKWPGEDDPYDFLAETLESNGHLNIHSILLGEVRRKASAEDKRVKAWICHAMDWYVDAKLSDEKLDRYFLGKSFDVSELKSLFKRGEVNVLIREKALEALSHLDPILIDMRDYSTSDRRLFNSYLTSIQKLWQTIQQRLAGHRETMPNLVIVLQKELFSGDSGMVSNYFLGKMNIVILEPFTPQELIDAYKLQFHREQPFKEAALLYLARMSRGVFRRFLRYVQLCLEEQISREADPNIITLEQAQNVVTPDEVQKDWRLEMSQIFKNRNTQTDALSLVILLMKKGPTLQSNIAQIPISEGWNRPISKMEVSRLADRLEEHGYIRRERTADGYLLKANI